MAVEVGVGGDQVPEFVDWIDCDGNEVVQVVMAMETDGPLGPGTYELFAFHEQEVDVVAFPREGAAVVRAGAEKGVDLTAVDAAATALVDMLGEQAPLVDAQGFYPDGHFSESAPEVGAD